MTGSAARSSAQHEEGHQHHRRHGERDDRRRTPGVGRAAPGREQDDGGDRRAEQRGPEIVDRVMGAVTRQVEHHRDDGEGDGTDRQVDVEHPPPAQVLGDETPGERADDTGEAKDRAEVAHVAAPLAGAHDVADDRLGADHQPAGADPLQRPEPDQLAHVLRQPRQRRPDEEDDDRRLEELLPAVEVTELAPQRGRDRRGENVGGHHPGQMVQAMQVARDRRQRRGDDRLVERRQEHAEHQRPEDHQDPAVLRLADLAGPGVRHRTGTSQPSSSPRCRSMSLVNWRSSRANSACSASGQPARSRASHARRAARNRVIVRRPWAVSCSRVARASSGHGPG